jgi:hypothetical protein
MEGRMIFCGRKRRKLRMLAVKVIKLGIMTGGEDSETKW